MLQTITLPKTKDIQLYLQMPQSLVPERCTAVDDNP